MNASRIPNEHPKRLNDPSAYIGGLANVAQAAEQQAGVPTPSAGIERLRCRLDHVSGSIATLHSIADSVFGARPPAGPASAPANDGQFYCLESEIEELRVAAEEAVDRFRRLA